ncbi:ATP-dependent helicase [Enterobacter hormaechei]|uniref:ATP-dependent helicase n=1 Tax=Enterobacter hormaechei TaxID=158836 RepID=UPI000F83815C|nr:ATP-dependent helicase [Enterobacter hormaechei]MCM7122756.1 ATP-dependent helicase [Enterobacter hormaechei]RTP52918.1 ATP-dependent helicase [Enterobacter hormaechei]
MVDNSLPQWNPEEFIVKTNELESIIYEQDSLSILAGPGAGKTEMLAQKTIYLLEHDICPWPKKILFLTFKNEASKNVKDRVLKRSPEANDRFLSKTYHSFAKSIVDRFRLSLDENIRPNAGYDVIFKGKSDKNKVHISDVIKYASAIIKNNGKIPILYQECFTHIFLDEFQDTTLQQYELISLLFLNSQVKIICVGDLNQSIMLFAQAYPEIYRLVKTDFKPKRKLLISNFRAGVKIKEFLSHFQPFVEKGVFNQITPHKNNNCTIHHFNDDINESEFITDYVLNKIASGFSPEDICILTRQKSSNYSAKLCDRLNNKGISNIVYDTFQDAIADPLGIIFSLILECALIKSPKAWSELLNLYIELNIIDENNDSDNNKLITFIDYFSTTKKATAFNDYKNVLDFITNIIDHIGLNLIKSKWPQHKSVEHTKYIWTELAKQLHKIYSNNIDRETIVMNFCGKQSLKIMNIHKCKGLEYKAVILIGFEDEAFWNYSDDNFEERCVLYVAFTRAKEEILITQSDYRDFISGGRKKTSQEITSKLRDNLIDKCGFILHLH